MEAVKTYADIKDRLEEITAAVSSDDMALDAALDLYEEAVDLGSQLSNVINDVITVSNEQSVQLDEDDSPTEEAQSLADDGVAESGE